MRSIGCRPALVLLPLMVFAACKDKQSIDTAVVVEVTSDIGLNAMNAVTVIGTDMQGKELYSHTFNLTGPKPYTLPIYAGIYPLHDTDAPIRIKAMGLLGDAQVVSRSATLSFERGKHGLLTLQLLELCRPVVCELANTTCKESGNCEPDTVTAPLPAYESGRRKYGQDAAAPRSDATAEDATAEDAPAEAVHRDGGFSTSDGGVSTPSDGKGLSPDSVLRDAPDDGGTATSDSAPPTGGSTGSDAAVDGPTSTGGSLSTGGNSTGGGTGPWASGGTGGASMVGGATSSAGTLSSGGGTSSSGGGTTPLGGSGGVGTTSGGTTAGSVASGGSGGVTTNGGTTAGSVASGGSGGVTTNGGTTSEAGTTSSGGTGGSSSSTGGTTSVERPAGYWKMSDWGVTNVDWQGCVWAITDNAVSGSDTTLSPVDFTSGTPNGGPYQVKGSVFNDYAAFAMLGFNLNQPPTGMANQCDHASVDRDASGTVTIPESATGIAINWTATRLPLTFRIQIQGVNGTSDPNDRWCATIKDAAGPSFVPFTDFNTTCWNNEGSAYANQPIDAITFMVPGTAAAKSPYDVTVIGFAPGTSKADAPGAAPVCGTKTGTIGTSTLSADPTLARDASFQRTAVAGKDCKTYVIYNNNYRQPDTTYQQPSFLGNSFKIDAANGTPSSSGNAASFPSIYVGANGNIANGTFDTWNDTGLPKAIDDTASATTTFKWSGKSSGDFTAAYDIWFAKTTPVAGSYDQAISGSVMVWLYAPAGRQPLGRYHRIANIGGSNWDVYVGPRGTVGQGTDDENRPILSYVIKGAAVTNAALDLKAFFDDAVQNADADKSFGGTSQAFSANWLLTDVSAGFLVWTGSSGVGLQADEFTFQLN